MDKMTLETLEYIVIDIDGTMTDGGIYYDESGNELKKFNTRDAAGFFAAKKANIKTMILTGRQCGATERRMEELGADYVFQNVKTKYLFLKEFMVEKQIASRQLAYIGDDLNDLQPMSLAGFVACPRDAATEIKNIAHYVSCQDGGQGVVRDVMEYILRERQLWDKIISEVYMTGVGV